MSLAEGPPAWSDGERCFLDTNVLLYTDDKRFPEKHARARRVIAHHRRARTAVVSTQVLQEYFSVATRKLGVQASGAQRKVEFFARMHVVQNDVASVLQAIDLHRLHQFSFWDALIVHAALAGGCTALLSEDMHDGHNIRGLRVVNPFAGLSAAG